MTPLPGATICQGGFGAEAFLAGKLGDKSPNQGGKLPHNFITIRTLATTASTSGRFDSHAEKQPTLSSPSTFATPASDWSMRRRAICQHARRRSSGEHPISRDLFQHSPPHEGTWMRLLSHRRFFSLTCC